MSKSEKKLSVSTNGEKTGAKIPQKSQSGKTTRQIMNRHIKDKNDVITEEEFKNLEIELQSDQSNDTAHEPLEIKDDKDRPKDEDKDPKIKTPWDVIN